MKKDAEAIKRKIERELEEGAHTPKRESGRIRDLAAEYLKHLVGQRSAGTISPGSYRNSERARRISIVPKLGGKLISELAIKDVTDLTTFMLVDQDLAPKTAADRRLVLKQVEEWSKRRGYTRRLIVSEASRELRLKTRVAIEVPTKDDLQALLMAVEARAKGRKDRPQMFARVHVHLAAFCGLRYGEIAGLTLDAVDFARKRILVRRSMNAFRELKGPKTEAGIRDVPLPAHLAEMLAEWIRVHYVENDRHVILTTPTGKPVGAPSWHDGYWRPILRRAGLFREGEGGQLHFHSLRHFAGSWWLENGLPIPVVAKLLGHSRPDMTLRVYAHALRSMEDQSAAFDTMSQALLLTERAKDAPTGPNPLI